MMQAPGFARNRVGGIAGLTFLLMGAVVAFTACQKSGSSDSLFPLQGGHRWTYSVTTQTGEDAADRETLVLRTLGPETVPALGDVNAWRRRSDSGIDYWLQADDSGIYRIASKSDMAAEPTPDKPRRYVLKAPYTVGTQWQAGTTPYLLMRRNEFPRELRHLHPNVPMTYQIEAVADVVDTPAGHFERCLRVRGTATVRVYADPATGWRDLPLVTQEWYCPGVGLVKMKRSEQAGSAFLTGGTRTLELQSWQ
jgi:hypothetical protein